MIVGDLVTGQPLPFQRLRTLFDELAPAPGEGVLSYGDLRVSQRGAGANQSVDITAGTGWVRIDTGTRNGLAHCYSDATANVAVGAAHATLPRIDMVALRYNDSALPTGSGNTPTLEIIAGTATGGATLDNRTGAAALPNDCMLLADILVPAASSSVVDANIRDRRPFQAGAIPPLLTDVDMVHLWPHAASAPSVSTSGPADLGQAAGLCYLPRRIVAATRLRWKYTQGGTAATGTYVLGIYDSSGRKVVDTGAVALTGGSGTSQVRSETIAATTLEAGAYYIMIGVDYTNAGSISYVGSTSAPIGPNLMLSAAAGGATAPATVLGFTDQLASPTVGAPFVVLSVG